VQALWDGQEVHLCAPAEGKGAEALRADELRNLLAEVKLCPAGGNLGVEDRIDPLLISAGRVGQIAIEPQYPMQTLAWGPADGVEMLAVLSAQMGQERLLFAGAGQNHTGRLLLGESARYWGQLARLVMELLRRRQFYPDLEERAEGQLSAVWRLVLGEKLTEALPRYAAAMPPACRLAHRPEQPPEAREIEPLQRVESFLNRAVDDWVRRAVAADPFFDRPHELAGQFSAPVEVRWLSALLGAEAQVRGEPADRAILLEQVRNWTGRLDEHRQRIPWRLCITLHEPVFEEMESRRHRRGG